MDEKNFDELLRSVGDMGRHMRGEVVTGARRHDFPELDVYVFREGTGWRQTRCADLIGVRPKTLQNWEQHRVRPSSRSGSRSVEDRSG